MITKTIKYKTYDGDVIEEKFYFNLSRAEILEMAHSVKGGYGVYLNRIIESKDNPEIMKNFKEILLTAVGRKSDDGKRFIKNQEIRDEFEQSEAYSELLWEICTDAKYAGEFIKSLFPAEFESEIKKIAGDGN
ncbi:MAG: hypothetical protein HUJ78_01150 [Mogibacterium sp.]|nr:hypothetical protein [Mogibacterium sp.]MCF0232927.1 hypothetical protein [Enterococcus sp.]